MYDFFNIIPLQEVPLLLLVKIKLWFNNKSCLNFLKKTRYLISSLYLHNLDIFVFPSGLTLDLFVNQNEYIPLLSQEAGVRVLITGQHNIPFPVDEGFTVSPGFATSIGLRKVCKIISSAWAVRIEGELNKATVWPVTSKRQDGALASSRF